MDSNPFWSDSIVSNENSIAGVIAVVTALPLMLCVNEPVNGTKTVTLTARVSGPLQ